MALFKRGDIWWTKWMQNGSIIEKSTGARDKKSAVIEAARLRVEYSEFAPPSHCTLVELSSLDLDRARAERVTERRLDNLVYCWKQLMAYWDKYHDPMKVTYDEALKYIAARRAAGIKGQTIRRERQCFERACQIAHRQGRLKQLPQKWPKIKGDEKDAEQAGKWHPLPVLKAWLAELDPAAHDEVMFALYTGLRAWELKRAESKWLEPAPPGYTCHSILRVPAQASKTRKERVIPLSKQATEILQRIGKFEPACHRTTMTAAARRIGYDKNITMRDLRHVAASILEQVDRKAAQDVLGHTTERMTTNYLHSTPERLSAASEALNQSLLGTVTCGQLELKNELSVGGRREFRTPGIHLVRRKKASNPVILNNTEAHLGHEESSTYTKGWGQSYGQQHPPLWTSNTGWKSVPLNKIANTINTDKDVNKDFNWDNFCQDLKQEVES